MDPGTDGWETTIQQMTPGQQLQLRAVIVVRGPHTADKREVVDAGAQVRPPIADLDPELAGVPKPNLSRVEGGFVFVDDVIAHLFPNVVEMGRLEDAREGGLTDGFAGVAIQLRLAV